MHKYSFVLISVALFSLSGCIEKFYPDEVELKTGSLVVVAHLSNLPGVQSIYLSRSSTLNYPEYDPLSGCYVEIETINGDSRVFEESVPGNYCCPLDKEFLRTGKDYRIVFGTPEGERYESAFERMHPAPDIDSLYYIIEDGIQFYIDLEIEKDSGRYIRWQLIETFEIRNPDYPALIFDVDRKMKDLPDTSSWRNCWITLELPEIYTLDLGNVEGGYYRKKHLNYVSTNTRRLHYRYSLLVRQLSLSKAAFWYWDKLGKNVQSTGNLFDGQPSLTPSNICNVNNEEELIIGYFSISGVSESRIFVENVPELKIEKDPGYCAPGDYPRFLYYFHLEYLPVYLATAKVDGKRKTGEVNKYCVDCREYKGSSHIKPEFW